MKRLITLLAAALTVAAVLAPSAMAGKSHLLSVYKVEKHIDVEGEDGSYTISCKPTDIALDGMWRVDNVDQDNDYQDPDWPGAPTNISINKSVRPVSAIATAAGTFTFKFTPLGGGDAQIKLFLTCLPNPLVGVDHTHSWTVSALNTVAPVGAASPNPVIGTPSATATCPGANDILVAPGFNVLAGDPDLVRSYWNGGGTPNLKSWQWWWYDSDEAAIDHYYRCLSTRSGPASSGPAHTHRIVTSFKTSTSLVPAEQTKELQLSCGELYKGVLGGFDLLGPAGNFASWVKIYYLGMDPRPKTRAWKFVNLAGTPQQVRLGLLCFKDRTT